MTANKFHACLSTVLLEYGTNLYDDDHGRRLRPHITTQLDALTVRSAKMMDYTPKLKLNKLNSNFLPPTSHVHAAHEPINQLARILVN